MRIKRWLGEEEKRGRGEKDIEMTVCTRPDESDSFVYKVISHTRTE